MISTKSDVMLWFCIKRQKTSTSSGNKQPRKCLQIDVVTIGARRVKRLDLVDGQLSGVVCD